MNTTTRTIQYPKIKGQEGYFSPDGFSKASKDYDVLEHINELKNHVYEGKKIYANAKFQIVHETIVQTTKDL